MSTDHSFHPAFKKRTSEFRAQHGHNKEPFVAASVRVCLLTLSECDLDVKQATELRDWLNEVLP